MNNKWLKRVVGLIALLLLVISCQKKYDLDNVKLQDNYESEWGVPLFDFKSTLKDYYETYLDSIEVENGNAEITIGSDGLFHFLYDSEVRLKTAEESFIFTSPLTIDAKFSSIPEGLWPAGMSSGVVTSSGESQEFVDTIFYELDNSEFHDAILEKAKFKDGDIKIEITTDYQQKITATCRILSFKDANGNVPEKTFVEFDHTSLPQEFPVDMAGVNVDFRSPKGNNYIMVEVTSKFKAVPGTIINKNQRINARVTATDLKWETVEGKVGKFDFINEVDTLKIDVLDESVQDIEQKLVIYDPQLGIRFKNTAGVPVAAEVQSFDIQKRDGSRLPLALTNTRVTIPADDLNHLNDLTTPGQKDYFINKGNSNIVEALKGGATHLIYDIDLLGGDLAQPKLWLRDTSRLVLEPSVDIPFNFSFTKYEFSDTVECMLCDNDSINDAEVSAELKLIIENGLPIDVEAQGYFYDTLSGAVIDSLFDDGPLKMLKAATTSDGKVIAVNKSVELISMDSKKFHKVIGAHFRYIAKGKTANGGNTPVKLHANDQFNIRAGVKVKIKADLSEQ